MVPCIASPCKRVLLLCSVVLRSKGGGGCSLTLAFLLRSVWPRVSCARKTAFLIFASEKRAELAREGGFAAAAKECSRQWKEMSAAERAIYYQRADEDKARYKQEMEAFERGATLPAAAAGVGVPSYAENSGGRDRNDESSSSSSSS